MGLLQRAENLLGLHQNAHRLSKEGKHLQTTKTKDVMEATFLFSKLKKKKCLAEIFCKWLVLRMYFLSSSLQVDKILALQ